MIFKEIININSSAPDCHICHAPYGHRHVVPSAVSLAGVYVSPAKPVLAGVYALPAPTGRLTGWWSRLSADIGRES